MIDGEILPGDRSGGATTSQTVVIPALITLLDAVEQHADTEAYERVVLEENLLGKGTVAARKRTFRYLRELYLLRPDSILFRALRDLWTDDSTGRSLLAGLCALARDPVFRASARPILTASSGDQMVSSEFADAVEKEFPTIYSELTLAKIGRNTFSSWEQTGHLKAIARTEKVRRRPTCTPATVAYALMLGYLEGVRGEALCETLWAKVLDLSRQRLFDLAAVASQRSLIDFRYSGGITDFGFSDLLRPMEGQLL